MLRIKLNHVSKRGSWWPLMGLLSLYSVTLVKQLSTIWAGSLVFFMVTIGGIWIIPFFLTWCYVLHVGHVSCVITNWGQRQESSLLLSQYFCRPYWRKNTRKLLSLSLDLFFKIYFSRLLFLYSFLSLYFLPTFFRLDCYGSTWIYFSLGIS